MGIWVVVAWITPDHCFKGSVSSPSCPIVLYCATTPKPRSTECLSSIEEKYDFPATHIVSHVATVVGFIVCVVGLVMIIWGLTPVIKRSVSAPKMVEQQEVTAQQVQECAQNMKPATRTAGPRKPAARRVVSRDEVEEESEALPPDVSLDKLQEAMPASPEDLPIITDGFRFSSFAVLKML